MPELIGQEHMLEILGGMLKKEKYPTSFLISGPEGSGKKTLAKLIIRAVNCMEGRFNEPCSCNACHKIGLDIHPDVRWFGLDEEAYSIKIEDIHTLINWASYKVLEGKKKVFVLNGADRLTEEAANALLKTLEEPPPDSLIFLLVENPGGIRETLLSRCFRIRMQLLPPDQLERTLVQREGWSEKEASLAAKYSQGRLGAALDLKSLNLEETRRLFLEEILPHPVPGTERWAGKKRHEVLKGLEFFSFLLRDLAVYRETANPSLLYHEQTEPEFKRWSGRLPTEATLEALELIEEARTAIEANVNPKIALFRLGAGIDEIYERHGLLARPAAR